MVAGTNFVGAEYLCRRSKTIHIECTQIRTSNVVQYCINRMYDTIILWLHTTIEQERHHWLAGYCKQGTNGTDRLDGALVVQGWDGQMLAGAGTGAPPWAPEQERHCWLLRGGALCEVVAGPISSVPQGHGLFVSESKTIQIECTQI